MGGWINYLSVRFFNQRRPELTFPPLTVAQLHHSARALKEEVIGWVAHFAPLASAWPGLTQGEIAVHRHDLGGWVGGWVV